MNFKSTLTKAAYASVAGLPAFAMAQVSKVVYVCTNPNDPKSCVSVQPNVIIIDPDWIIALTVFAALAFVALAYIGFQARAIALAKSDRAR